MKSLLTPAVLVVSLIWISVANGQDPRQQRREFVQDLLRGLIESQLEQNQPQRQPGNQGRPVQPNLVPGQGRPGQGRPGQGRPGQGRPVVVEVSPQMIQVRRYLKSWSRACTQLMDEIRRHEYESPQLRPLLADALKVQANIELISRKAQIYPTVDPLVDDFQIVDRDWRMLSYRLKNSGGLTAECSGFVNTIAELDQKLCGVFQIQPQVDRREIARLGEQLSADYNHLLNDVYYVCRNRQGGRELMTKGKNLQASISQSMAILRRGDYDTIVSAYSQCINQWKDFSRNLHQFRDERLRRSVAKIENTGRHISEQLWLPVQIDRQYLSNMANLVAQDTGSLFDNISMAQLLNCKNPTVALGSAREFQTACANFSQSIASNAPVEDLEWDYRLFEVQWNNVHNVFHDLGISEVDHRLDDIQFSMQTLKQTFGDTPAMDYGMLVQMMANMDAMCRQATHVVHRRIVEPTYDHGFHEQICSSADRLSNSVSSLHQRIIQNPHRELQRSDFNTLFTSYRDFKPLLTQCKDRDKGAFTTFQRQIEPLMVKLQVVYAD